MKIPWLLIVQLTLGLSSAYFGYLWAIIFGLFVWSVLEEDEVKK